jgi:TatA/E family protein of Tat protein translocase
MPSIGPLEIMVVCVVALVVFGPARLPEIARSVGKALSELKRQASEMKTELSGSMDEFKADFDPDDEVADDVPAELEPDDATPPDPNAATAEIPKENQGPIVHQTTTKPNADPVDPT